MGTDKLCKSLTQMGKKSNVLDSEEVWPCQTLPRGSVEAEIGHCDSDQVCISSSTTMGEKN